MWLFFFFLFAHSHSFLTKQAVPLRRSRMKPRLGRIIPARKTHSPLPRQEKKRKRKKEYKLLMVRTTNSRRRAFPPSGRCSSYCTRSHSAGARSHAHAWLKCCFHRPKKRRKPLGVILYCLFFFSHQSRVWVRLHMVWEIHEHAEGCYHPCKNEAIPAQS